MPAARNASAFLAGRDAEPKFDHRTVDEISDLARDRWMVPRAERRPGYRRFRRNWLSGVIASGG